MPGLNTFGFWDTLGTAGGMGVRALEIASSSFILVFMSAISMIASDLEDRLGALHYEDFVQAVRVTRNGGSAASLS